MLDLSHAYESLSSVQFQALVQTIASTEYDRFQAMPLRGRDGGRDGVVMTLRRDRQKLYDSVVLQVKAYQYPAVGLPSNAQLYEWAINHIRAELPSIRKLIDRGSREYIFITNIPGSGDLDTGVRDRVMAYLQERVSVPATVWFREDIDSRLRGRPDIAARHGLILGLAGLRALLNLASKAEGKGKGELENDVLAPALTAFFNRQHKDDARLRFRQVEIDSNVMDSYIDVRCAGAAPPSTPPTSEPGLDEDIDPPDGADLAEDTDGTLFAIKGRRRRHIEANFAEEVLAGNSDFDRVVLEGAPGQGKSTATQYICQVHRARLLGKLDELSRVSNEQRFSPQRLPFRVELRKCAAEIESAENGSVNGVLTYLASLITAASEVELTTGALAQTLIDHPSIIALDGLDEVGDLQVRERLIDSAESLADNLKGWGADCQIIITSRPSTIQSRRPLPGVASEVALLDLDSVAINSYAEVWLRQRSLIDDEADEFQRALAEALALPHVADLARNPMQLAILLFLVYARGWSLPEKRTELYEAYLDTFLTREAEKSPAVRRNRTLLLELHGFVAWLLHGRVERASGPGANRGDISREELERVLSDYLTSEERPTNLVQELFDGVQRVFVLVERDEGRFEFEVQPLREFFAARHLYKTSPQAPANDPVKGTRPDRLDALIVRPFWLNATRFFCGYYEKGELADLTRRLIDLTTYSTQGHLRHSRDLPLSVLSDYSVSSSTRDTRALAATLTDELGLYSLCVNGGTFTFSSDTGLETLIAGVRRRLESSRSRDDVVLLGNFLRGNDLEVGDWWLSVWSTKGSGQERGNWLRVGTQTGALNDQPLSTLMEIFSPASDLDVVDWFRVVEGGFGELSLESQERFELVKNAIAWGPLQTVPHSHGFSRGDPLSALARLLSNDVLLTLRYGYGRSSVGEVFRRQPDLAERIAQFDDSAGELVTAFRAGFRPDNVGVSSWAALVTATQAFLGDCWTLWRVALIAATQARLAQTTLDELSIDCDLLAECRSLLRERASVDWLEVLSDQAFSSGDMPARAMGLASACLAWAPTELLLKNGGALGRWWSANDDRTVLEVSSFVTTLLDISGRSLRQDRVSTAQLAVSEFSWSLRIALSHRSSAKERDALLALLIQTYDSRVDNISIMESSEVLPELLRYGGRAGFSEKLLALIKHYHGQARSYDTLMSYRRTSVEAPIRRNAHRLKAQVAQEILTDPLSFPAVLVDAANSTLTRAITGNMQSLRALAEEERWFEYEDEESS